MVLSLNSIWNDLATPVDNAARAVGDAGSYVAGAITGNQQAQQNASNAFGNALSNINTEAVQPIANGFTNVASAITSPINQVIYNSPATNIVQAGAALATNNPTALTNASMALGSDWQNLVSSSQPTYDSHGNLTANPNQLNFVMGAEGGIDPVRPVPEEAPTPPVEPSQPSTPPASEVIKNLSPQMRKAVSDAPGSANAIYRQADGTLNTSDFRQTDGGTPQEASASSSADNTESQGPPQSDSVSKPDQATASSQDISPNTQGQTLESSAASSAPNDISPYSNNTPYVNPGEEIAATPEDMAVPREAFKQLAPETPEVDFSKVDGAGKEYNQRVNDIAKALQQQDKMLRESRQTDIYQQVKAEGGISSADHEGVPSFIKNKNGLGMDKMAQVLGYPDDQALMDALESERLRRDMNANTPKKTFSEYKEDATKYLLDKADDTKDPEGAYYHDLLNRASIEMDMKAHEAANKASGYAKVRNKMPKNVTQPDKGMTDAQLAKYKSPEWKANNDAGTKLNTYATQLKDARKVLKVMQRQAGKLKSVQDLNDHNARVAPLLMRIRRLTGLVSGYSEKYAGTKQALADKYGDTVLYKNGRTPRGPVNTRVGGAATEGTVKVNSEPKTPTVKVASTPAVPQTEAGIMEDLRRHAAGELPDPETNAAEALGKPAYSGFEQEPVKPYDEQVAENAKKAGVPLEQYKAELEDGQNYAFSDEDIAKMNEELKNKPSIDYGEDFSSGLPFGHNLEGDEVAHQILENGGTIEDATKAYMDATGVDRPTAEKAVNDNIDLGQIDTEETASRNPEYQKLTNAKPKDEAGVLAQQRGIGRSLDVLNDDFTDKYNKLSDEDREVLEKSRGKTNAEVVAEAHDPEAVQAALDAMDKLQNVMHEQMRQNGSGALYRQNYRAGLHAKFSDDPEADEEGNVDSPYNDELYKLTGRDRPRNINNYEDLPKGMERQHANIWEDVQHDIGIAKAFTRDRALARGLDELHGSGTTVYGAPDSAHPFALYPSSKVFTTKDIATAFKKEYGDTIKVSSNKAVRAAQRIYRGSSSGVVQAVVVNPLIHGKNLLNQGFQAAGRLSHFGVDGGAKFMKNLGDSMAKGISKDDLADFYREGNHAPTYKGHDQGLVSKWTHGLTDVNKNAMHSIDLHIRVALWKTLREAGMGAEDARDQINTYLGDEKAMTKNEQAFGFFYRYFRTKFNSLVRVGSDAAHGNTGSLVNLAVAAAAVYAIDKGINKVTGNNNSDISPPGNLALLHDVGSGIRDIYRGHYFQAGSTALNNVNPLIKEGVAQITNKDMRYGTPVTTHNTWQERLAHAAALTPETNALAHASNGKKSFAESALNAAGINTPHAKGYQATPNIGFFNEPNAKSGTGLQQQDAYFNSVEYGKKDLKGSTDTAAYNLIHAGKDGKSVVDLTSGRDETYLTYPDVLQADTDAAKYAQAHGGGDQDPFYTMLTPDQQKTYLVIEHLKSTQEDNAAAKNMEQSNASWLQPFYDARTAYYNKLNLPPGASQPTDINYKFPQATGNIGDELTKMATLTGQDKYNYIQSNPDLLNYFNQYNDALQKQADFYHEPQEIQMPTTDQATSDFTNTYLKADKATQAQMRTANPDLYNGMESYLAKQTIYDIINQSKQLQFQNQQTPANLSPFYGKIYDAGKYDIAQGVDASGTKSYALDPNLAYNGGVQSGITYNASNYKSPYYQASTKGVGTKSYGSSGTKKGNYYTAKNGKTYYNGPAATNPNSFNSKIGGANALGENQNATVAYNTRHDHVVKIRSIRGASDAKGLYKGVARDSFLRGRTLKIPSPKATVKVRSK